MPCFSEEYYEIKYANMKVEELTKLLCGACKFLNESQMRSIRANAPIGGVDSRSINLWMWYLDHDKKDFENK